MTRVLVTGGSGRLAREVFRLTNAGTTYRVLSRQPRATIPGVEWATADLATGAGLDAALRDVDVILHLASDPRDSARVDVLGTRNLLAACERHHVQHLVYVSIIGVDAIPYPYYQHKLAAERMIEASRVPWSIVRAAQFHSLIDVRLERFARFPLVMPVPVLWQAQSVDDGEVALHLVAALRSGPARRMSDYAGPEILRGHRIAALWRRARGVRKPWVPFDLPGAVPAAFRAGRNTSPHAERGGITWSAWLAQRYRPAA